MRVTLIERGKPVEERGRSVGALMKRGVLDSDSNFCYGEGGAGTWSDGKLTTRIGRNSAEVRSVLETMVHFGAPPRILLDGSPHLGTDNLVRMLKRFRAELLDLGAKIRWDSRVERFLCQPNGGTQKVVGVALGCGEEVLADAVVLAAGHSARELYLELLRSGADLVPKDFAVGFRIEHPQAVVDSARYGSLAAHAGALPKSELPPAAYRLATTLDAAESPLTTPARSVYSFCMCPGGQIVPTSLDAEHLCINGMSYSNRGSRWANSAVVTSVGGTFGDFSASELARDLELDELDLEELERNGLDLEAHPQLAGLAFQELMEARAARMGGGRMRCPVQRVSDFLEGVASQGELPPSSYRLGVTAAPLHEIYPPAITQALRAGISKFSNSLPGFDCESALLHGVETRTSAPLRIDRVDGSCEAPSVSGLFPAGEGAGYAGGIVSAAVDGLRVATAIVEGFC